MKPVKNTEVESQIKYFLGMSKREDLLAGEKEKYLERITQLERKLWVHNPLTGYFVSRMQSNS
jgi:hypothetical protein